MEGDVEGEAETGSMDVEERHALARHSALVADVVIAVGAPDLHGVHSLVRLVREVVGIGVDPSRVLPIVNRAPRRAGARAQITAALAELCSTSAGLPAPPLFLPERRVEEAFADGSRLPTALTAPLTGAVAAVVERLPLRVGDDEPEALRRVTPGAFGDVDGADAW
jgi:hypothetical protein